MTEPRLPTSASQFKKRWPKFQEWLLSHGSAILTPTNPYELARFVSNVGTAVIYVNAKGTVTSWVNGAKEAYLAYLSNGPWRAVDATVRNKKTKQIFEALAKRDGCGCMYCLTPLSIDTATIEHVCSTTHGGPNHLANKALACSPCNTKAGHLSVREKLEMAIKMRSTKCFA